MAIFLVDLPIKHSDFHLYPLVMTYIAIESGQRNHVSFPMVIFHSYVTVYQRVSNMALGNAHK